MTSSKLYTFILIPGTAIGAGMLGLPMAGAKFSTPVTWALFSLAWILSYIAGRTIVSLMNHYKTEILGEAVERTLGRAARQALEAAFFFLCLILMATYICGGGEVLHTLLPILPLFQIKLVFFVLFSLMLLNPKSLGDRGNAALFLGKIVCLGILGGFVFQEKGAAFSLLFEASTTSKTWPQALVIFMTAFGYHVALGPVIARARNKREMRQLLLWGSLLPLGLYIFWDMLATVSIFHNLSLQENVTSSPHPLKTFLTIMDQQLNHPPFFQSFTNLFSFAAIATSFLGVGWAFTHRIKALAENMFKGKGQITILQGSALLIPLGIVVAIPSLFLKGLEWAGIASTLYAMIIPGLAGFTIFQGQKKLVSVLTLAAGTMLILLDALF